MTRSENQRIKNDIDSRDQTAYARVNIIFSAQVEFPGGMWYNISILNQGGNVMFEPVLGFIDGIADVISSFLVSILFFFFN